MLVFGLSHLLKYQIIQLMLSFFYLTWIFDPGYGFTRAAKRVSTENEKFDSNTLKNVIASSGVFMMILFTFTIYLCKFNSDRIKLTIYHLLKQHKKL